MENKNVFIGNLNFEVTEKDIKTLFSDYGTVVNIKMHKKKGYAFIEMAEEAEAALAIEKLNGSTFMDREVRVSLELKAKKAKALSIKKYNERSEGFSRRKKSEKTVDGSSDEPGPDTVKNESDDKPVHTHRPPRDRGRSSRDRAPGHEMNYPSRERFSSPDDRSSKNHSRGGSNPPHPRRKEWPDDRPSQSHRHSRDGKRSGYEGSPEDEPNFNTWERFPGPVAKPANDSPRGRSDSQHPQRREWSHDKPAYPKRTSRDDKKPGRGRSPRPDSNYNSRDRYTGQDSRPARDHSRSRSDSPHPQRKEWSNDRPSYSPRPSGPSRQSGGRTRDESRPRPAGGPTSRSSRPKSGPRGINNSANSARPKARGGAGNRDRNSRPKKG
jgi:RNA recognition motif-containing protein